MNKTHDKISEWTDTLAERLTEIRFLDMEEMKLALKVHLAMAMKDCLDIQVPETQKKINRIKILLSNNPGKEHGKYQAELVKLKEQAHQELITQRNTTAIIRKDEKFKILAALVGERFGNEVLEEFKRKVKDQLNIVTVPDDNGGRPANAYDRGVTDTLQRLRGTFEANGLWDAMKYLE